MRASLTFMAAYIHSRYPHPYNPTYKNPAPYKGDSYVDPLQWCFLYVGIIEPGVTMWYVTLCFLMCDFLCATSYNLHHKKRVVRNPS